MRQTTLLDYYPISLAFGMTAATHQNIMQHTLLLVDDEKTLRDTLEYNLRREGYRVLTAADGPEALRLAFDETPDLILLDIMMPGMSGFDVCRAIRQQLSVPILMLSAREGEIDKVLGLELGADDYITKPFSLAELLARVHARLRRAEIPDTQQPSLAGDNPSATPLTSAPIVATAQADRGENLDLTTRRTLLSHDLSIEIETRTVMVLGRPIEMKRKEFDLLIFLAANPMKVFTREELLEQVWGYEYVGGTRTVDVHVRWLREKLEQDPAKPQYIQTVHRVGYKFGKQTTEETVSRAR